MASPVTPVNILSYLGTVFSTRFKNSRLTKRLAALQLAAGVWQTLSVEQEAEVLRNAAILKVAEFVKKNPEATKEELLEELEKQILEFARQIEDIQG